MMDHLKTKEQLIAELEEFRNMYGKQNQYLLEDRYQMLFNQMLDGFAYHEMIFDPQGRPADYRFLEVNPAFENITGLSANAIRGKRVLEVIPGLENHWIENYGRVVITGEPYYFENNSSSLDKHFEVIAYRPREGHFACIFRDITERKRMEEALRESEQRWATTLTSIGDAVIATDETGLITFMNNVAEELTGWTLSEVLLKPVKEVFHIINEYTRREVENPVAKVLENGLVVGLANHTLLVRKDGTEVPIDDSGAPIRDKEDNLTGAVLVFRDITERKLVEKILRRQSEMLNLSYEAIFAWELDGAIITWNRGAQQLYGYSIEEASGRVSHDLLKTMPPQKFDNILTMLVQTGTWTGEMVQTTKNGRIIIVETRYQLFQDESGRQLVLETDRDITERKHAEEELRKAKEEAEKANAAKSQFLANMSHEIRTPMNGIIGMTELTLLTDLTKEQREYLTIVESSTQSLLRVLNDILDYTKIEAGKIVLENQLFNLRKVINEVNSLFGIAAKQKDIDIHLIIDDRIPENIIGDSVRLRQVLSNLVGNAIKFTSKGIVGIEIKYEELSNNGLKLRFIVSDTGIGISEDKLDRLFKSFSQVDDSYSKQFSGTGLGLAISKKLVEIMGGNIWVESKEEIGSKFSFTAVFRIEEEYQKFPNDTGKDWSFATQSKESKKVLLVEDDQVSRSLAFIILQRKGLEVVIAENGREAMEKYQKEPFDLILMDINLPYLDGYSVTTEIRQLEKVNNTYTPIIAMTAYALMGDKEKCLEAGMDDYISKPVGLKEINALIDKWLRI